MNPQLWLESKFPIAKVVDHDWTMERYDFPQNVRDWIIENWTKLNNDRGGTYRKPGYQEVPQPQEPQ